MDFRIEQLFDEKRNCWKVTLFGEIDIFNSADVKEQLNGLVEQKSVDMHVNCKQLTYIDSTGLGALVGVLKRLKGENREMHLNNVRPNISKLFRITNLNKVFIIDEDGESND
jgi:anti-sigma B factor antagonist